METQQPAVPDLFPSLPDEGGFPIWRITRHGYRSRTRLEADMAEGRLRAYKVGGRLWTTKADLYAALVTEASK